MRPTPSALLFRQVTLYELQTYGEVYRASAQKKSLATLSRETGRDISGYTRTIERLNDLARQIFKELLLLRGFQKGMPWVPTSAGQLFYDFCQAMCGCLDEHVVKMERLMVSRPVRIAMPQQPLYDMLKIEDRVNARSMRGGSKFEKQIYQIRSEQVPSILLDQPSIDFAFGGLVDPDSLDPSLEFVEIRHRRYGLISNYDFSAANELEPDALVSLAFLQQCGAPLLIAHIGVIVDALLGSLGVSRDRQATLSYYLEIIRERYNIVEECNDSHFMIELLCASRVDLCMLGTRDIFLRACDRAGSREIAEFYQGVDRPLPEIRFLPLSDELPPLRVGVIRRRQTEKMRAFGPDHPYSRFWEASLQFAKEANVSG